MLLKPGISYDEDFLRISDCLLKAFSEKKKELTNCAKVEATKIRKLKKSLRSSSVEAHQNERSPKLDIARNASRHNSNKKNCALDCGLYHLRDGNGDRIGSEFSQNYLMFLE